MQIDTLQVNLGYRCNQTCSHCHVAAGPRRTEQMSAATTSAVLAFLESNPGIRTLDLTGGAPEMNPNFRWLVRAARALGLTVIDRCNLTILLEPGYEDLARFLADTGVDIVASLPCYLEDNVDQQRGEGVFAKSIEALQRLNALGYGRSGGRLRLNLVYNPQGPVLPPPQQALETAYRGELRARHGIEFDRLLTLANMPIQRFRTRLRASGELHAYMDLLRSSHRDENLAAVMCRTLVSVDWQGYLYDCDFNQQLHLHLDAGAGTRMHIGKATAAAVNGSRIRVGDHCWGCTAGQGSGCGGALR